MVNHTVKVRAPRQLSSLPGPLLLSRSDPRFMETVRNELGDPDARAALLSTVAPRKNGELQLLQPIHRAFAIGVAEVVCDAPGQPRLDPAAVESSGLVVRRIGELGEQAWSRSGANTRGWVDLESDPARSPGSVHLLDDPDAKRRKPRNANPVLAEHLSRLLFRPSDLSEDVTDLFVLPPDVCARAKATLLYGLVPTASLDVIAAGDPGQFSREDVLADLPDFLKSPATLAGENRSGPEVPAAGGWLGRPRGPISDPALAAYLEFVERVAAEYDLLGKKAERLRRVLGGISVVLQRSFAGGVAVESKQSLLEHIEQAAAALVFSPAGAASSVRMPIEWPRITAEQENGIVDAVGDALRQQVSELVSHEGRFSNADARYVVRTFVRVRRADGCAPAIFWSERSEPFTIAPWYQAAVGPTTIVPLPDPFKNLGAFKPNVAFALPASISDVVHKNSAKDLLEGKGSAGAGLGLAWLCGFNIPLITLCAFIVLSIFLSLLNIIFWWLPLIRICIPIPAALKKKVLG
jgi:hypothetical protein